MYVIIYYIYKVKRGWWLRSNSYGGSIGPNGYLADPKRIEGQLNLPRTGVRYSYIGHLYIIVDNFSDDQYDSN